MELLDSFLPSKPSQPLGPLLGCYHVEVGHKPSEAKYSAQADGRGGPDKQDQPDRRVVDQEGGSMPDPMYRQIADDLRGQIESGELEPGQQLRTELELRERYEASRNTVRDAS